MVRSRGPFETTQAPSLVSRIASRRTQHQTYVAERNLEPDHSGLPIQNPLVERYFTDFSNGR